MSHLNKVDKLKMIVEKITDTTVEKIVEEYTRENPGIIV